MFYKVVLARDYFFRGQLGPFRDEWRHWHISSWNPWACPHSDALLRSMQTPRPLPASYTVGTTSIACPDTNNAISENMNDALVTSMKVYEVEPRL